MSEIRSIVTFQSSAFNVSEPKDYFVNDCCYGDDVARWLLKELRSRRTQTDEEPVQEDFGWYVGFRVGDRDYQFIVGHRPNNGSELGVWIGWVERKRGLLLSILGARHRNIQPDAVRLLHSVLSAAPQVSDIRWHRQSDFDAGREESGQADPTAN